MRSHQNPIQRCQPGAGVIVKCNIYDLSCMSDLEPICEITSPPNSELRMSRSCSLRDRVPTASPEPGLTTIKTSTSGGRRLAGVPGTLGHEGQGAPVAVTAGGSRWN